MTPTLVLTRPEAQSRALAAELAAELGPNIPIVISPVLEIEGTGTAVDLSGYAGVILTSANAVRFAPDLAGIRAYCVGERTAEAARNAGADVKLVAQNADDLVARLKGPGPLIHLRGEYARGQIADRLKSAGIDTHEAVIYRQNDCPLSEEARELIEGETAVILPLYSPRSAELVGAQVEHVGRRVRALAISLEAAKRWRAETGTDAEICPWPTGAEMRTMIEAALQA